MHLLRGAHCQHGGANDQQLHWDRHQAGRDHAGWCVGRQFGSHVGFALHWDTVASHLSGPGAAREVRPAAGLGAGRDASSVLVAAHLGVGCGGPAGGGTRRQERKRRWGSGPCRGGGQGRGGRGGELLRACGCHWCCGHGGPRLRLGQQGASSVAGLGRAPCLVVPVFHCVGWAGSGASSHAVHLRGPVRHRAKRGGLLGQHRGARPDRPGAGGVVLGCPHAQGRDQDR
mmetsp:Transcript_47257/g.102900  ORF Transcript_47257/g.102900 Transcript_47257/m.102900 type:complete len:229 (-) Transcript_47257:1034-1720(-)